MIPPTTQIHRTRLGEPRFTGQESGAGEDPGADHVGDHQRGGAEQAQLAQKSGFSGSHYFILRVARPVKGYAP